LPEVGCRDAIRDFIENLRDKVLDVMETRNTFGVNCSLEEFYDEGSLLDGGVLIGKKESG
jgi:hypothetical protein